MHWFCNEIFQDYTTQSTQKYIMTFVIKLLLKEDGTAKDVAIHMKQNGVEIINEDFQWFVSNKKKWIKMVVKL